MWIEGKRRGGAKQLSIHLQKPENESVNVRTLEGFAFDDLNVKNLEKALKQMEAIGYGKGIKRNLFHTILAPAYGETLTPEQRDIMLAHYLKRMGFEGHQHALVEHWKKGKQHFHLAVNLIHPVTGRVHELKWSRKKEYQISREIEQIFGFKAPTPKGKSAKASDMQRGKRSGIDPRKLRKEVTQIFNTSMTAKDFVALLDKNGLSLTRGRKYQLVVVDRHGDTHGLMRLIEGKKLADVRRKFPELGKMQFKPHDELVRARKPANTGHTKPRRFINPRQLRQDVLHIYRTSKSGQAFSTALGQHGYYLGRGLKSYVVVDKNGDCHDLHALLGHETTQNLNRQFPDLPNVCLCPASDLSRYLKSQARSENKHLSGHPVLHGQFGQAKRQFTGWSGKTGFGTLPLSPKAITVQPYRAAQHPKNKQEEQKSELFRPMRKSGGWPEAAIRDWLEWGHKDPRAFFARWPELASGNAGPSAG